MKSMKFSYHILIICFFILGCTNEDIHDEQLVPDVYNKITPNTSNPKNLINYARKSSKELIIEYQTGISENLKDSLRKKYHVIRYEKCDCTTDRIEKWEFGRGINIEGEKEDISEEGGVEGTDYEFTFYNDDAINGNGGSQGQNNNLISSYIKSQNTGVTIAIIDTGIDFNKFSLNHPFLYNPESNDVLCEIGKEIELSGWDFINHDANVYDDNGHGTLVTLRVINKLREENVTDYQILSIKAFNHLGKTTNFTLQCSYLKTIKSPISIINMSFGWYGTSGNLLRKFISENPDILHITSSGNNEYNNDNTIHYPSSYTLDNIVAIGSINYTQNAIASFSNYGPFSVDFLSFGDLISIHDNNYNYYEVSGTSYAAPLVTAKSAKYYTNGYTTSATMLNQLETNGTNLSFVSEIKYNLLIE
ncbi:S8 family serine peptidase [Aquimarina sp. AU474]|uniref:S8 family peptidase n=1 Tax=Aquimarina sp. AU474 TaxID=2108529 RepID=UPI000D6992CC|nr:S8 family serine peptidase [Aquimarina sp. AU474]